MNVGEGACACYWMEPTMTQRVGLRRFSGIDSRKCPARKEGYGHDADVITTMVQPEVRVERDGYLVSEGLPSDLIPRGDPQWPTECERCGYAFQPDDTWQIFGADGYVRSDTEETVWTRHVMGVEWAGALFDVWWLRGAMGSHYDIQDRGDGIVLGAVCPNGGHWYVDGKATSGGYWSRSGDPRNPATLSVSPSIICGKPGGPNTYHGFLTNGHFTPHIG